MHLRKELLRAILGLAKVGNEFFKLAYIERQQICLLHFHNLLPYEFSDKKSVCIMYVRQESKISVGGDNISYFPGGKLKIRMIGQKAKNRIFVFLGENGTGRVDKRSAAF